MPVLFHFSCLSMLSLCFLLQLPCLEIQSLELDTALLTRGKPRRSSYEGYVPGGILKARHFDVKCVLLLQLSVFSLLLRAGVGIPPFSSSLLDVAYLLYTSFRLRGVTPFRALIGPCFLQMNWIQKHLTSVPAVAALLFTEDKKLTETEVAQHLEGFKCAKLQCTLLSCLLSG
jgi:hypothetical protein